MTTALNLAKYIIADCIEKDYPLSNFQLQHMLYYIQREFIRKYNKPAFSDGIEARSTGPVIPEVYYMFCHYGHMPLDKICIGKIDTDQLKHTHTLNKLIRKLQNMTFAEIRNDIIHPNNAWSITYQNSLTKTATQHNDIIEIDLIKKNG